MEILVRRLGVCSVRDEALMLIKAAFTRAIAAVNGRAADTGVIPEVDSIWHSGKGV